MAIKARDGTLHHLPPRLHFTPLADAFRRAVLDALRRREVISERLADAVREWDHHGGFSVDASVSVPPGDTTGLERVAAYVLRPPLSLARLTYRPGAPTVIYHTRHTPVTGGNFVAMDAKEFLVRLLCLVAEPYQALIRYFGAASSTWRRKPPATPQLVETTASDPEPVASPPRRSRRSWARLIRKMFGVDPLKCSRCGGTMEVLAYIHDPAVIERILRHLHRWDPPPSYGDPGPGERTVIDDDEAPVYEEIDEPP